ncbi:hypothetical protein [Paenibacillus silagei]|uniref:Uncharacterized protein n=1 Tax=Paenibacillus silagei TaxID=1670801 RepID=A0ABS4P2A2_9BACL|nr:hypothetical protein [Paenibacillus silagei]MBP2115825.1 hypothetical protein [Paenibacillus silagei]
MDYLIRMEGGTLRFGTQVDLKSEAVTGNSNTVRDLVKWDIPAGVYRAKDIVREAGILLEAVCARLGDAAAGPLLRNLQASLAVSGREAVLPFAPLAAGEERKSLFLAQAEQIGTALSGWAREIYAEQPGRQRYGYDALLRLVHRSRCDQHLWTPEAVGILMGPAGSPEVMQLFNEYLHQLVLLRDILIPYENWGEVPLEIGEDHEVIGLRHIEPARDRFFTELIVKRIAHKEIVRFTQKVLCPELVPVGYGFQYRLGTVLPAAVGKSPVTAAPGLLRWHPAQILPGSEAGNTEAVAFDYEQADYGAAPRSYIDSCAPGRPNRDGANAASLHFRSAADIVPRMPPPGRASLELRLTASEGGREYRVDLGQALRGHRYMYRPGAAISTETESSPTSGSEGHSGWLEYEAADILDLPGLVDSSRDSIYYVSAEGNTPLLLGLLGKLFPQNVVIIDGDGADEYPGALRAGKQFGAKFLLHRGIP